MPASLAEVKGVIASKQGLSCSGYMTLANLTVRLRERLYVTVRDGDKLFLPQGNEHFPTRELEAYYLGRCRLGYLESIGAGGGEVVFTCEGPAADEGAAAIAAALPGLEEVLNRPLLAREIVAQSEGWQYRKAILYAPEPPYRPDVLPERPGVPEPVTEEERRRRPPPLTFEEIKARTEEKKRALLKKLGLEEAYQQMQREAAGRRSGNRSPRPGLSTSPTHHLINSPPWQETPWK
jgi:hypothetical protein